MGSKPQKGQFSDDLSVKCLTVSRKDKITSLILNTVSSSLAKQE